MTTNTITDNGFFVDDKDLIIPIVILKTLEDGKKRTATRIAHALIERWKGKSEIAPHLNTDNINRLISSILEEVEAMQEVRWIKRDGAFYSITSHGKEIAQKTVLA